MLLAKKKEMWENEGKIKREKARRIILMKKTSSWKV